MVEAMRQRETRASGPRAHDINPAMIVLAREARGMSQGDLAHAIGASQGLLSKIEAGLREPGTDTVRDIAKVLHFPESFFTLRDRIYGPSASEFYHRKRSTVPVRVLAQIHANINMQIMFIERLLRSAEYPEIRIRQHSIEDFDNSPAEVARAVRSELQVPKGPIRDLTEVIEDAGGVVVHLDFGTDLVDAVSWWIPRRPPMIFLNANAPGDRMRMNLAHELGHLVMHQEVTPEMEDEANRFAAEFLAPADEIKPFLRSATLKTLAGMKPFWKVSMQFLLKRAQDVQAISDGAARYMWIQISKAGYRKREPPELDIPRETPSTLRSLIEVHMEELGYSADNFAQITDRFADDLATFNPIPGAHLKLVE
ncbi:ImmA/IrrE family metallo-endopeptidase [Sorangium sp. So ce362]|uniref:ImmA/IrrE family metallo-endopeptidase n=1 Tax=Sorangium sp. So ce362 TaxID=3133303 RepID=UPI003F612011